MKSDARVFLQFYKTDEGGRRTPILPSIFHGNMMFDETCGYDFRTELTEAFAPGDAREVGVKFLCPEDAFPRLTKDARFVIWEGHPIGEGRVMESFI
jgi:hypothetical protein